RRAVEVLTGVSEERLLNEPGMQPLRRELLESALPYYREFLRQRGDDPATRAELARAHFHVARITDLIGPESAALAAYERARGLFESLARAHPDVAWYRQDLAKVWNNIGNILGRQGGRRAEALRAHREALALRRRLVDDHPSLPEHREDLARSYYNIGRL